MEDIVAIKHTVPNIIKAFQIAGDLKKVSIVENVFVSVYATVLLLMAMFINLFVRYVLLSQNTSTGLWDCLIFLFLALSFDTVPRLNLKPEIVTLLICSLSSLTIIFITIRFYDLIGPAVWTVAYIHLILAQLQTKKTMVYFLAGTIIFSGIYVLYSFFSVGPYQISLYYYLMQIVLFVVLFFVAASVHKVNAARFVSEEQAKATICRWCKTQEQLIQQENMAGLGQLAAGVAHEINNPLGYVSSNFETAREYCSKYKEMFWAFKNFVEKAPNFSAVQLKAEVEKIKKLEKEKKIDFIFADMKELFNDTADGLKRVSDIVRGLKSFSRVEREKFEEYDLNQGIKNTLLVAKNEIKYVAQVEEQLGEIPTVQAKGSQINQVLLNLIMNASYAIKAKNQPSLGQIRILTEVTDGFVHCEIADDGIGIEEKNTGHLFEPFFTTKPIGSGTGLGLSIAYDIVVNKHRGEFTVESTLGVGTKFRFKLPVRQTKSAPGEEI